MGVAGLVAMAAVVMAGARAEVAEEVLVEATGEGWVGVMVVGLEVVMVVGLKVVMVVG
jgi:hypothetical protein